jgi:hypothetical protein
VRHVIRVFEIPTLNFSGRRNFEYHLTGFIKSADNATTIVWISVTKDYRQESILQIFRNRSRLTGVRQKDVFVGTETNMQASHTAPVINRAA